MESLLTDYQTSPSARTMACAGRSAFVRAYFARKQFGVNLHICMNVEDVPWHVIVQMTGH